MESKIAIDARQALVDAARRLTPEQRLRAFFEHSQLMTKLYLAGRAYAGAQQRADKQP